jgi:hypothetical protein
MIVFFLLAIVLPALALEQWGSSKFLSKSEYAILHGQTIYSVEKNTCTI